MCVFFSSSCSEPQPLGNDFWGCGSGLEKRDHIHNISRYFTKEVEKGANPRFLKKMDCDFFRDTGRVGFDPPPLAPPPSHPPRGLVLGGGFYRAPSDALQPRPNSGGSQFFINTKSNDFLDWWRDDLAQGLVG